MKRLKSISYLVLILIVVSNFYQCASMPKLQKKAPTEFEAVYFQKWNAGIQDGGSGVNVFIEMKDDLMALDSVYFRGKAAKLQVNPSKPTLVVGRFKSDSMDQQSQFSKTSFKLKANECVISYKKGEKMLYYKIVGITERKTVNYPTIPNTIK